jgi:hypothetical protein
VFIPRAGLVVLIVLILFLLAWLTLEQERRKQHQAATREQRGRLDQAESGVELELREVRAERDAYRDWVADLERWHRELKLRSQESMAASLANRRLGLRQAQPGRASAGRETPRRRRLATR